MEVDILKKVEAVVFDWAGTIIDFGSVAPVLALKKTFESFDIKVTLEQIRESMGKNKIEHIKDILSMESSDKQWTELHNRTWNDDDVKIIYKEFERSLLTILENDAELIEGVPELFDGLRKQNIKIGSSTGYTRKMMKPVLNNISNNNTPDYVVTGDEVEEGRPSPDMINKNLELMEVTDVSNVINIGDTLVDIQSGKNAGAYSVGVIIGSSEMGLTKEEYENLSDEDKEIKINETRKAFMTAGADDVVKNISDVTTLISKLEGNL